MLAFIRFRLRYVLSRRPENISSFFRLYAPPDVSPPNSKHTRNPRVYRLLPGNRWKTSLFEALGSRGRAKKGASCSS